MEQKDFLKLFADAIEVEDFEVLSMNTLFRELDEWSSLAGLEVIAMFKDELDFELTPAIFKTKKTIGELFDLINK